MVDIFNYDIPPAAISADSEADIAARPSAWGLSGFFGGVPTVAGVPVTPRRAMALPAYYASIRNISEDVAKLPLITYQRLDERAKRRAIEHPLYTLLKDAPNPDMSSMTFRETMNAWVLGWGNAYAEIERSNRGEVVALWPIHPARIPPQNIRRTDSGKLVYDIRISSLDARDPVAREGFDIVRVPAGDIFHLHGLGDGYFGMSVAQVLAQNIGLNLATQTFASSFFGNGMHIGAVLEHPGELTDKALVHLRESMRERHQGVGNAHDTLILEEGMTFSPQTVPPNEAQFLETRQFGLEDIARVFRIPPHKIQHLLRSTFTNIEHQALEYVTDTLMPWFVRWEQEIQRKLFVGLDGAPSSEFFAEHLVLGLLRGDMKTRAEYMWKLFQMGALSPDDVRAIDNQNPLPDGQGTGYYLLGNMVPLQDGGTLGVRQQQQQQNRPQQATQTRETVLPEGVSNGHAVNV